MTSVISAKGITKHNEHEMQKLNLQLRHSQAESDKKLLREYYEQAHILLSEISREASLTSMTINWRSNITRTDWDKKHKKICKSADRLRMISPLLDEEASDLINNIYSELDIYWGNYGNFLYRIEQGDKVDHNTNGYMEAMSAGRKIQDYAANAKKIIESKTKHSLDP
ncbi:MAG: hypothetical protein JXA57_18910 [Armatimonadetes bacterium]|nr:hypothetical protein [Armatimonadota bacterium]